MHHIERGLESFAFYEINFISENEGIPFVFIVGAIMNATQMHFVFL